MKLRKHLSAPGLIQNLRNSFEKIPDSRNPNQCTYTLVDALMAGFTMFSLKSPSLLQFSEDSMEEVKYSNLKNLYGLTKVPSDTGAREILDEVSAQSLRRSFKRLLASAQRGKVLEEFLFLNSYLISIDGTGYFSSHKVHCSNCCQKNHKNGDVTYYHQMLGAVIVHPDKKTVLPLCPEPIIQQDGKNKNDCERNAAKRFLIGLKNDHPHMKIIITEDGLSSNGPHIELLKELDMSFILGAKPKDHKSLFEFVEGADRLGSLEKVELQKDEKTHKFRFINDVPLNDSHPNLKVNFLEYWETDSKGKTQHFSWVTDITLTKNNVFLVMKGGRARWKIENETFNTLKNQGYQFEHNFGHGYKNLSVVFAFLMMLAFLVDQIQEMSCHLFQQARRYRKSKKSLWERLRALFSHFIILNWEDLWTALGHPPQPVALKTYNSS